MNNQVKLAILAIVVVIPISSFAVWASDSNQHFLDKDETSKIQVIASFYPIYEFTKTIGQDRIDVTQLLPPGVEPHDWDPSIQDIQRMQIADLVVINGIGFEHWVEDFESMQYQGKIVDTSKGIEIENLGIIETDHELDDHEHISGDPHIWLNPVTAKIQVRNISDSLSEIDPNNAKFYQTNAESYIEKLDNLDNKIRNELSSCSKDFIAFHNAFAYFAEEYDLHQHVIITSNQSHSEATPRTLENIINLARQLNIDVIFTEEAIDTRTSQVIANEIGGKVLVLSPLEVGDENDNYVIKMEQNLENLKEALC